MGLCVVSVAWAADTVTATVTAPVLSKAALLGQIEPAQDPGFAAVPGTSPVIYLRKDTLAAFERMRAAAASDGIKLRVISATRNFTYQKGIWERKWNALQLTKPADRSREILRYSSMPGTSRHHWGTDMDLNDLSPRNWESGELARTYAWLERRGGEFGFCLPYSKKGPARPVGYNEERWHWSYRPLSSEFLKQYLATVTVADIKGFLGAETAREVRSIEDYVAGVNPVCK